MVLDLMLKPTLLPFLMNRLYWPDNQSNSCRWHLRSDFGYQRQTDRSSYIETEKDYPLQSHSQLFLQW